MRRHISLLIIISMMLGMCACKNGAGNTDVTRPITDVDIAVNGEGYIVGNNDEEEVCWYTFDEYVIESDYVDVHYNQVFNYFVDADEQTVTTMVKGYLINNQGLSMYDDGFQTEFCHLAKYNYITGEKVFFFDLSDYNRYDDTNGEQLEYSCVAAILNGNVYSVVYRFMNYSTSNFEMHILSVDANTGDIISDTIPDGLNSFINRSTIIRDYAIGNGEIAFYTAAYGSSEPPYISGATFTVYDIDTDTYQEVTFMAEINRNNIFDVGSLKYIDDNHYAITMSTESFEQYCLIFDTDTMEKQLLSVADMMSDIEDDISNVEFASPTNTSSNVLLIRGDDYIAKMDVNSLKFVKVFDLNHCNMNRSIFENGLGPISVSGDVLIMGNGLYSNTSNYEGMLGIFAFTRCEGNPYEGRHLLRVATIDNHISNSMAELIYRFNDAQDEVYIAIDESYVINNGDDYYWNYNEYAQSASQISSQLAVDLMSGSGPDIILDSSRLIELNRSEYLIDLNPYLEESGYYNNEEFFAHIFEIASNDAGELFQVPIAFSLSGISTDDLSRTGYTFEEYDSFVANTCNGWNPIAFDRSQLDCFVLCFNAMSNEFIYDDTFDIDKEAFRALAEYCNTLPSDGVSFDDYWDNNPDGGNLFTYNANTVIWYDRLGVAGLPSIDGRGPGIMCSNSIGISSNCANVDEAINFILFALSDESQTMFVNYSIPVNRNAYADYMHRVIDIINSERQILALEEPTYRYTPLVTEDADRVIDATSTLVDSSCNITGGDSDVAIIIYEEIAAYFAGDKTLDEVIPIIENRVQTVLNER